MNYFWRLKFSKKTLVFCVRDLVSWLWLYLLQCISRFWIRRIQGHSRQAQLSHERDCPWSPLGQCAYDWFDGYLQHVNRYSKSKFPSSGKCKWFHFSQNNWWIQVDHRLAIVDDFAKERQEQIVQEFEKNGPEWEAIDKSFLELQDAEKGFLEMKESLEVEDEVNLKINIKKNEMLAVLRLVVN